LRFFEDSLGFRVPKVFRTIMSYPCGPGDYCSRVLYFSTPEKEITRGDQKYKLGSASANNLRILRHTLPLLARTPIQPPPEKGGIGSFYFLYPGELDDAAKFLNSLFD
ncbi:MAG: hypothetical protein HON90_14495, partial [Halobacteriovoraceae bacterium]|nr:hypothetical protein [Halobacteriovoraceae bacterium]